MRSFVAAGLLVLLLVAAPVPRPGRRSPFPSSSVTSGESYATPRGSNLVPRSIFDPSRLSISNSMVFGYSSAAATATAAAPRGCSPRASATACRTAPPCASTSART